MKRLFIACLLFTAGGVFAQTGMFAGLGIETNANTREGAALGGSLTYAVDINRHFSAGVKTVFSGNMATVTTLEPAALFRYYLPLPVTGFFAQAEAGVSIFFENDKSYPAFLGGLAAGWRYMFDKTWFIEPSFRGGYPFAWGFNVQAGLCFDLPGGK